MTSLKGSLYFNLHGKLILNQIYQIYSTISEVNSWRISYEHVLSVMAIVLWTLKI